MLRTPFHLKYNLTNSRTSRVHVTLSYIHIKQSLRTKWNGWQTCARGWRRMMLHCAKTVLRAKTALIRCNYLSLSLFGITCTCFFFQNIYPDLCSGFYIVSLRRVSQRFHSQTLGHQRVLWFKGWNEVYLSSKQKVIFQKIILCNISWMFSLFEFIYAKEKLYYTQNCMS